MKDFLPYFTNDGSPGLYSEYDKDVYHSVNGALSEAYEKFLIPSGILDFLDANSNVKILDICYGIGYNTKSFLNELIKKINFEKKFENYSQKNLEKFFFDTESIYPIDTDNNLTINSENFHNNNEGNASYNFAIGTDNIAKGNNKKTRSKFLDNNKNEANKFSESQFSDENSNGHEEFCEANAYNNKEKWVSSKSEKIDFLEDQDFEQEIKEKPAYNIREDEFNFDNSKISNVAFDNSDYDSDCIYNARNELLKESPSQKSYSIKIDAIDINSTLVKLSPFFTTKQKFQRKKTGIEKIDKLISLKKNRRNKIKLEKEVNQILLIKLLEEFGEDFFDKEVKKILSNRRFSKFFDKSKLNFMKFYQNRGYKLSKTRNKSTFLHNIYYRYLSRSYKNTLKILENNEISIRYMIDDARKVLSRDFDRYDFIFLDAFTPALCPSLWTYDFFKLLYQKISYDGLLITYSKSAAVRNALLKNNFYVGKIFYPSSNKFAGTIASKNPDLIKHPLDDYDIGLANSRAGIVFKDPNLNLSSYEILKQREIDTKYSNLPSTSQFIKNFKGGNKNV